MKDTLNNIFNSKIVQIIMLIQFNLVCLFTIILMIIALAKIIWS